MRSAYPARRPPTIAIALLAIAVTSHLASAGPSKKDEAAATPAASDAAAFPAADAAAQNAERDAWHRALDRRIGRPAGDLINIYNTWTHEYLVFDAGYRGAVDPEVGNRFLRCHFTNHQAQMEPKLLPAILAAANHFRSPRVDVVSGFRSPKYNLILRKKGRRVARDSQHTHGRAVDFRLRGIPVTRLRDWARSQKLGGVGFYPGDGFVHIDTWRVRFWTN